FSSRRRHTRSKRDWSSDVCSSDLGAWNPLSEDFGGWLVFFVLLVFAAGFVLFGLGAVLWTFIFPIVRPQLVVSRWGVEASWWKPGGRTIRFAAPWTGIVSLGGQFLPRRWPMPDGLIVTITAHGTTADMNRMMCRKAAMVTHRVSTMLHGRSRDVLAFLVQVRGAPPGQSRVRSVPPQRDTKIPQPPRRRLGDPQRPEGSGPQGLNQANRPGPASRCDSGQAEALAEPVDLIAQCGRNRIGGLGVPYLC